MKNKNLLSYSQRLLGILFLLPTVLWAQKPANYVFTSSSGTFTSIVQGSNATLVAKASGTSGTSALDDVIYNLAASTVPFSFTYDSAAYTGLNISSNGFIAFGSTSPVNNSYVPLSASTGYAGAIAPLGIDLTGLYTSSDTGQIWHSVEGTSPNREFVIEWANFKNYTTATSNFYKVSLQVRLHENNSIRFVYNYAPVGSPTTNLTPQVGLRGANNTFASNVNNRMIVSGQNNWAQSYPGTSNSSTMRIEPSLYFANGLTYTYTPPVACNGTPTVSNIMGVTYSCGTSLNLYNNSASYFDHYGYTYTWQESSDGTNYSTVSGGTVIKGSYSRSTFTLPLYFRVQAICANTNDTGYSTAVQIQNPDTAVKKYTALPYTTGFESAWQNGNCYGGENPDSAWTIYPRTGNNAWRRNDQGSQASWTSTNGAYSPTGANSSSSSARFHSYNSSAGLQGSMYLHFDASTLSGTKQVSFYYINTSGSDSLFVSLSTDTGQTYTQIAAFGTSSSWAQQIIALGNLTQTRCILKLEAISDYGSTDIGVDELDVDLVPSKDLAIQFFSSPSAIGCVPDSSDVKVFIKNTTTSNLNLATDTAMIQTIFRSATYYTHLNSGTLNAGDSMEVTLLNNAYTGGTSGFTLSAAMKFPGDGNNANDSIYLSRSQDSLFAIPYTQPFSASGPSNWSFTGFGYNSSAGNGGGGAYRHNLYGGNSNQAVSPLIGTLSSNSFLKLDYRAIDYSGGGATQLKTGDSIFISISTDCGLTRTLIYTIDSSTHAPTTAYTTLELPLGSYSGKNIRVYINGQHNTVNNNDYYFSIDNFIVYDKANIDMAMPLILSPNQTSCSSTGLQTSVRVKNEGIATMNFATNPVYITMQVTGAQTTTILDTLQTGTLAPGASQDVVLNTNLNLSQTGVFTIRAWLNTASDPVATNDTAANVVIEKINASSLPYFQGFENLGALAGWQVQQVAGSGNWAVRTTSMTNPTLGAATGSNFLYFNSYSFSQGTASRAISPCLNLTGTDNPYLEFKLSQSSAYTGDPDSLYVQYSTDGGGTWTNAAGFTRLNTSATTPYWQDYSVCLPMLANTDNVRIALLGISSYGDNFGVDDLQLKDVDLTTSLTLTTDTMCLGDSNYVLLTGSHSELLYLVYTDSTFSGSVVGNDSSTVSVALNLTAGSHTIKVYALDTIANCGSYLYDSATVLVNAPYYMSVGPDTSFCSGDSILLQSSPGHLNYRWNTNDLGKDLWISTGGTYIIYAQDSNSCALSDTLLATMHALPTPNLGIDTNFCENVGYTLNAGSYSSYVWNDNSNAQTLFVTTGGTYAVTVTDSNGCSATDSIDLIMDPAPTTVLNDAIICADSFAIFDGGAGYASYLWTRTGDSGRYTVGQPGMNILIVTTDLGCSKTDTAFVDVNALPVVSLGADTAVCEGSTVNLSATTGGFQSYYWSDASSASTLDVQTTGTYWLRVTDANGCKNIDSIDVVFSIPHVDLGPDTGFCAGTSFVLDAGSTSFTYAWSTSPTDVNPTLTVNTAGQYSVLVKDSINCTNADTINVAMYSLPTVNLGGDQAICAGDSALFAETDRPVFYSWNNGSTDSFTYYDQTGPVFLTITDMNGCMNSDSAYLTVNSLPTPNIGPDSAICQGHSITLSPGTIYSTYAWSTGSGASAITVSTAAVYSLTVTDSNGCQGSDQMVLSVNSRPDASFTFTDNGNNNIDFNATDTLKYFLWSFGDGDTSTMDDPQHQYPGQGSYVVTLHVVDSNLCVDSSTQSLSLTSLRNTISSKLDVQVYPNPTSQYVHVSMDVLNSADLRIELYDIQGKLLKVIDAGQVQGEHKETLDLNTLAPGNYTLRVQLGGEVATFKVVKTQH